MRLRLSYGPDDLFLPDWGAAVGLDSDCDETLEMIEFTNLQLLEYRHIDARLDESVATAYQLLRRLTRHWFPFWRNYSRPLLVLGELQVEANELFERTGNAFKLVGDQYLARAYGLLAKRFPLVDWEQGIRGKLNTLEGVYRVLADQAATYRGELLEVIVIVNGSSSGAARFRRAVTSVTSWSRVARSDSTSRLRRSSRTRAAIT